MRKRLATIFWVLALLFAVCFTAIGCEQAYRALRFSDEEAAALAERDRTFLANTLFAGFAGIDQDKEIRRLELLEAVQETQAVFWQWVTLGISTVGGVASSWLAQRLGKEKKTLKTVVATIDGEIDSCVKKKIQAAAMAAGVENNLNKVVEKVTG